METKKFEKSFLSKCLLYQCKNTIYWNGKKSIYERIPSPLIKNVTIVLYIYHCQPMVDSEVFHLLIFPTIKDVKVLHR